MRMKDVMRRRRIVMELKNRRSKVRVLRVIGEAASVMAISESENVEIEESAL